MASSALTREESLGLAISVIGHAALLALLLYRPVPGDVVKPPERIEVTISDEVALESSSPDPSEAARASEAADIGDQPPLVDRIVPAPEPSPVPEPAPAPAPRAAPTASPPKPAPRVTPVPKPAPRVAPAPKPAARPAPAPVRRPATTRKAATDPVAEAITRSARTPPRTASADTRERRRPDRPAAAAGSSRPASPTNRPAGASRIGSDFLEGAKSGERSAASTSQRAATIGPREVSALNAEIGRQLKPHWRGKAPEGAEAELLVTRVRFRLNRDGSLAGEPQVLATSGQTEANRPQVARHQEQAVRAVRLAAPFSLPEALYDGWKVVTTNFDRKLSQ